MIGANSFDSGGCDTSRRNRKSQITNHKFLLTVLLLLSALLLSAPLLAQETSQDSQRHSDLEKIRSRIGVLKKQLVESQKNVATLSEEVKRLDLRVEIGERETQLLAARRTELAGQLEASTREREAAAGSADRFARALVTRATTSSPLASTTSMISAPGTWSSVVAASGRSRSR